MVLRLRHKTLPDKIDFSGALELTAAEPDSRGPRKFSMRAYTGTPMTLAGFPLPVVVDLAGMKGINKSRPILRDHNPGMIVGHGQAATVGDSRTELEVSGLVSGAGPDALEVVASADNGFPWQASIGAQVEQVREIDAGKSVVVNGRTFTGPLIVAKKTYLREISFVALGADDNTTAKIAASSTDKEPTMNEFELWLKAEYDLAKEDCSETSLAKLQAKFDATKKPADPPVKVDDPTAVIRATAAKELERIEAIGKIEGIGDYPAIQAQAIKEGWDSTKTELAVLRAMRPKAPAVGTAPSFSMPAIEAAFCRTLGLPVEKHFQPEVLEASDRYKNIGLQEVLLACASANGYTGRQRIRTDNLRDVLQAAFSVHSVTTLLTETGNKILLEGFNAIPQKWRQVAATRNVTDFKTMTAFRLTASLEYDEVGPGGEIQHGTLGQESYTYSALTYAKMLALTRQDIINDDLGAFNDLRNRLGMGAALKLSKVFWTAYLGASNGGAFWTATRGNLVTSASLATAGLGTAVQAFREMAGPDGNMMDLDPRLIVIPPALEATALGLFNSAELRDTTASTKTLTTNIYKGRFTPVVVPELGKSTYTGYSATTWYMHCDPGILASAVVCFLNGQQSPTIESADADFNTLGIQLRGYHDFGVAMTEYRASVEATA